MLSTPERLRKNVRDIVENPENILILSSASSWEIAIKVANGRLFLPESIEVYIPKCMRLTGVQGIPIQHAHALAVATLPPHHRDPIDRLLIAQAQVEKVPIITVDPVFANYDIELVGESRQ